MAELTEFQRAFADQFLILANATKAYLEACKLTNHDPGSEPRVLAAKIKAMPAVKEYLKTERDARAVRANFTKDMVVQELKDQLAVTLPDVISWNDDGVIVKPAEELTANERKALKRFRCTKTIREAYDKAGNVVASTTTIQHEVELHDRLSVVKLAGDHLGVWKTTYRGAPPATRYVVFLPAEARSAEDWAAKWAKPVTAAPSAPAAPPEDDDGLPDADT